MVNSIYNGYRFETSGWIDSAQRGFQRLRQQREPDSPLEGAGFKVLVPSRGIGDSR